MQELLTPGRKDLRNFGIVMACLVVALFGVMVPWLFGSPYPTWPWLIAGMFAVWAIIAPTSLVVVYKPWMRLGLLLNRITTPIILGIVFYLVVTPMALVMKILQKDPMARRTDEEWKSFRVMSRKLSKEDMEKPF